MDKKEIILDINTSDEDITENIKTAAIDINNKKSDELKEIAVTIDKHTLVDENKIILTIELVDKPGFFKRACRYLFSNKETTLEIVKIYTITDKGRRALSIEEDIRAVGKKHNVDFIDFEYNEKNK